MPSVAVVTGVALLTVALVMIVLPIPGSIPAAILPLRPALRLLHRHSPRGRLYIGRARRRSPFANRILSRVL